MYEANFKRFFDILLSLIAIILFLPILIILYFLVKFDTSGPFIFKQERVGKMLQKFVIYKIRTMSVEASKDANDESKKYVTTSLNDKRVTKIGNILRKFHLDELPQFWNVLKGDMSIIGIRPDHISQKADYDKDFWIERHSIRPGITGLSQIKSDKFLSNKNARNKYDMFYIRNKNKFKIDIYIFFMTFLKILKGRSF